jgi:hypothetical protein
MAGARVRYPRQKKETQVDEAHVYSGKHELQSLGKAGFCRVDRNRYFSTPTAAIFVNEPGRLESNLLDCGVRVARSFIDGQHKACLSWTSPKKEKITRSRTSKHTYEAALVAVAEAFLLVSLMLLHDVAQEAACPL